jgi:murein DD-endopeptidase MepM/ murein hydrolase activator NlpD
MHATFEAFLAQLPVQFVLPVTFQGKAQLLFDLTAANEALTPDLLRTESAFCGYISESMAQAGALLGVGAYAEDRVIYRKSEVFSGAEARSLHLGIDLWAPAGTPLYAPIEGTLHSFANNGASGDYGPTIILEHCISGQTFYTLYGHLSLSSLQSLEVGMSFAAGQPLGSLGAWHENVHWPPHLHFQIIRDLEGRSGDFPGVCAPSEAAKWLALCPDPNLLLRL